MYTHVAVGADMRGRLFRHGLVACALIVGPLFGAAVDLVYLALLVLIVDRVRLSGTRATIVYASVVIGVLLWAANPLAEYPYFSYFFLRLALLVVVFQCVEPGIGGFPTVTMWVVFTVYVAAIVYQYLALPGSELFESFHAEMIVDGGPVYRASGLFSGYFSAATIIGSIGVLLILRSGAVGMAVVAFAMLIVAFCSGRSIVVFVIVAFAAKLFRAPRVAVTASVTVMGAVLVAFALASQWVPGDADFAESVILFSQIFSILSGDVAGTSTEVLVNKQYYMPHDWQTLLLGNNERPFTHLGVQSDSGYMQLLFGVGAIGAIVYVALLVAATLRSRHDAAITLLVAVFFVSFKGNAFNSIGVVDILLLLGAGSAAAKARASPRWPGRVVATT